jgi:hypothetical protein
MCHTPKVELLVPHTKSGALGVCIYDRAYPIDRQRVSMVAVMVACHGLHAYLYPLLYIYIYYIYKYIYIYMSG